MRTQESINGLAVSYQVIEPSDFNFKFEQEKDALAEFFTARSKQSALDQLELGMLYDLLSKKFGLEYEDVQNMLVCNNGLTVEEMR